MPMENNPSSVVYVVKEKKKSKSKHFHKFFWPCMLFTIKLILVLIGFFGYWFYRSPPSPMMTPIPTTTSASASNSVKVHLPPGQLCPNEWSYFNFTNQCYKYYQQKWSFKGAEQFCASKGAHLVSIHSREENDFVVGISEIEGFGPNRSAIWIGGHSAKKDEVFVWTDDSPMDFTWFVPNPVMHENCLELYDCGGWMVYCWESTHCDNYFRTGYVCKMNANSN
ncbi:hypothetical protein QR680_008332 [Steinernema hermaphroditum]|uniref:C-type lectin domain-containing protein n=1 Tax=Steinernema hermaphroditum TaxID=289476 RepID=A0AA39IG81_9BILA|nr:hypothetical protein QR680_008332 [Steinernema hermaphroditum]